MIPALAGLCTLTFIVTAAVVGFRLLLLSRKSGGIPELVFGAGLVIIVGLGYPMILTGRANVESAPDLARVLMVLGAIAMAVGWTSVWIFTWQVFRPDSPIARWTCYSGIAVTACTGIANVLRTVTVNDPAMLDFGELAYTGTSLMAIASYHWGGFESLRYYGMMRKRLALGLADPVVANRFLLWGFVMVFSLISTAVPTVASMNGVDPQGSPPLMIITALSGLGCACVMWLAFLPPQAYVERIRAVA